MVCELAIVAWSVAVVSMLGSVPTTFIARDEVGCQVDVRQLPVLIEVHVRPSECDDVIRSAHVSRIARSRLPHRRGTDGCKGQRSHRPSASSSRFSVGRAWCACDRVVKLAAPTSQTCVRIRRRTEPCDLQYGMNWGNGYGIRHTPPKRDYNTHTMSVLS